MMLKILATLFLFFEVVAVSKAYVPYATTYDDDYYYTTDGSWAKKGENYYDIPDREEIFSVFFGKPYHRRTNAYGKKFDRHYEYDSMIDDDYDDTPPIVFADENGDTDSYSRSSIDYSTNTLQPFSLVKLGGSTELGASEKEYGVACIDPLMRPGRCRDYKKSYNSNRTAIIWEYGKKLRPWWYCNLHMKTAIMETKGSEYVWNSREEWKCSYYSAKPMYINEGPIFYGESKLVVYPARRWNNGDIVCTNKGVTKDENICRVVYKRQWGRRKPCPENLVQEDCPTSDTLLSLYSYQYRWLIGDDGPENY